jgi:SAM-dependent methyltransferase
MTEVTSTTPLFLNGDLRHRLNPIDQLRFFVYHYFRNRRENVLPFGREISWPTSLENYASSLNDLEFVRTPSRLLCNIFWSKVDWNAIREELGALTVHDIGCGSGRYGKLVRDFAGFGLDYYGYEISKYSSWSEYENERTHFLLYDGFTYGPTFEHRPNVFISQSALEHIPSDLAYFRAVTEYSTDKTKIMQIHLVPGATGLRQWGLHGWRQYNRDMLRRIQNVLGPGMEMSVFCLGGEGIVRLHRKWARTYRLRKALKREPAKQVQYQREWREAVAAAPAKGVPDASFLAIVIEKGFSAPLWPRLLRDSEVRPIGA